MGTIATCNDPFSATAALNHRWPAEPAPACVSTTSQFGNPAVPSTSRAVAMLLTIRDVASLVGCTPKAVRHRVARGQLPGVTRIGGSVYLRRAEVLRFLAEGRGPSPERSR